MSNDDIAARLRRMLDDAARDLVLNGTTRVGGAMAGTMTNAAAAPRLRDVETMMREAQQHIRELRRTNVTIVVVNGHEGPAITTKHPTDGRFVECSYAQAKLIDDQVPLRFVKAIARDRAHFEVAAPIAGLVFTRLCPPPYEPTEDRE
jgi:hypothetical protein